MLPNLKREIDQIAKDKGIDTNEIIGALEEAMKQAARKRHGLEKEIEARYNDELGEIELFEFREVVEEVNDPENQIQFDKARAEYDPEAEVDALTALPGIGPWTASYIAMRALREPDAFPAGDLVLRQIAGEGGPPLSPRARLERSQDWRPWRAYAVLALWGLRG